MRIFPLVCLSLSLAFSVSSFAELQNEIVTLDAVGTIGYRDDVYFTVVLKPDFSLKGGEEIGFAKTDDLQLAPMQSWNDITPGLAVRVTYEELRAPTKPIVDGEVPEEPVVLERRALKLVIGQKPQRKTLVS